VADSADPNQEVIQFILEHLDTVPHLEALLLIWQNPSMAWTVQVLASRIYVSHTVAQVILEDFQRKGIVRSESVAEHTYAFNAEWDAQGGLLPRLADLYRRQLVQVTKMIHSKSSSSVRDFARAFQLKKDN